MGHLDNSELSSHLRILNLMTSAEAFFQIRSHLQIQVGTRMWTCPWGAAVQLTELPQDLQR